MLTPHGDQDSSDSSSSSPYDFFGEGEDLAISLKGEIGVFKGLK